MGRNGKMHGIGHAGSMDAAGAAVVNGTAAHGEDYDDAFEGIIANHFNRRSQPAPP